MMSAKGEQGKDGWCSKFCFVRLANKKNAGLEGAWTTQPFQWDNEFFTQLRDDTYELITGPGGAKQWRNKRNGLLMLTTDLAFVNDTSYKAIVNMFASDVNILNKWFGATWEKLVTSGGTFASNGACMDGSMLRPRSTTTTTKKPGRATRCCVLRLVGMIVSLLLVWM